MTTTSNPLSNPLSLKRQAFVREYLVDLNGTQAAIRAGYSVRTAKEQAARLLTNVIVASALEIAIAERAARTEITADRVLQELSKIGFADIRKAVSWQANVIGMIEDEDGGERLAVTNQVQFVDSDKLDDETAAAVAEVAQDSKGGLKIKFHDKQAALVSMGRHLGMFKDKLEHTGPGGGPLPMVQINIDATPDQAAEIYRKVLG